MVVWEDMWKRDGGLKAGSFFDAAGSWKVDAGPPAVDPTEGRNGLG